MQHLEVSGAVQHIYIYVCVYIYIYVVRWLNVKYKIINFRTTLGPSRILGGLYLPSYPGGPGAIPRQFTWDLL